MPQHEPGYPLPDGEAYTEDLACQLVYLPNKDEYWRALLGTLSYLSTWLAWERDSDKRGKDAARAWKDALDCTLECWRMSCLEDLQDDVAAIKLLLQGKKDCCDDNITYTGQEQITTTIDPGVGDPPDYYGETAVTDWDDWYEHVCFNAHRYVDQLVQMGEEFEAAADMSLWTIGLVAAALALLTFTGIGLPVALALASEVLFGLLGATAIAFDDAADDIEADRDEIVCALLQGTSLADAVKEALGAASVEWLLLYQWVDYDSATAVIYEGGYDGEYLPADTKDDCVDCGYEQLEDGDLTLHPVNTYSTNLQWNAGPKTWTVDSLKPGSCWQQWVQFFTDPSKTVAKQVRIEYVACSVASTCAASKHHRGYLQTLATLVYEVDHPALPDVTDGVIEELYDTHNSTFTIEFKLFEPS